MVTILFYYVSSSFLVTAQIFIVVSELAMTKGIPIKDTKAEVETHPVIAEAKTSKYSV